MVSGFVTHLQADELWDVQMENEELRMGQAILAGEVQSLRRDLGALAARSQVQLAVCGHW